MYLDHVLICVFLSSFPAGRSANAPSLRDATRMRLLFENGFAECVRYKDVVHLAENRCNLILSELMKILIHIDFS